MALDLAQRRSRRRLLTGAIGVATGAAAATVVGAIARPSQTEASSDRVIYTNDENSNIVLTAESVFASANPKSGAGVGVFGASESSTGVEGRSGTGCGVYGVTAGEAPVPPANVGVYGYSDMPESRGVYGATTDTTSETYGVLGTTQGSQARAVFGWSLNEKKGGTGVFGQSSSGDGVGVRGYAWDGYGKSGIFGTGVLGSSGSHAYPPPAARPNTGVMGVAVGDPGAIGVLGSSGPGTGVTGTSTTGTGVQGASTSGAGVRGSSSAHRGGIFSSPVAQLRLYPASASGHPSSGLLGDLFLDAAGNLWLCKGATTWVKLG